MSAESEDEIRHRLNDDPWSAPTGSSITSIEPVIVGAERLAAPIA
jgi:hypothetical protein